ncbi:MAG: ATP-binding protein [Desulfobulbaceae bacterium]|nr:ATP-binding protein [Desulfobulbaceae bacterium]
MQLKSVRYIEWEGGLQEWSLEGFDIGPRNLIVGKNASGKSRILNVISGLAKYFTGTKATSLSGNYDVEFIDDGKILRYKLQLKNQEVVEEEFYVDGKIFLKRGEGGEGEIWAEEIGKNIRFQTPSSELAVVARRDNIQHNFFEPLYMWGSSLRIYRFGSSLGKEYMAVIDSKLENNEDESDQNKVIGIYQLAVKKFGEEFKKIMISDMEEINYDIEEIGIKTPVSVRFVSGPPGDVVCFYVKEKDLSGITDQTSMSQGMFRVLSILIQINYSQLANKASCILVDDIGEGLDFDRSCRLIKLLRNKADCSGVQLILSTNDRFVMNNVPLEEWSVIQREGGHVHVRNYENSKKLFEEFKFTGLSNFSFLELDFINEAIIEE